MTTKKRKIKITSISIDGMNHQLSLINPDEFIGYEPEEEKNLISDKAYVWEDKRSNIHLMFKDVDKKIRHFVCDSYTGEVSKKLETAGKGGQSYKLLKKYLKKYNEDINYIKNDNYIAKYKWLTYDDIDPLNSFKWIDNVYYYDMNSAYLAQFNKPLPYGDIVARNTFVGPGQIGFNFVLNKSMEDCIETVFYGEADVIFNTKIYKGMTDYAKDMYAKRLTLTDQDAKDEFKVLINSTHGNLKYHNIFIATAIIGYCTNEIKKYSENVHVYLSTVDSIICDRPIKDIPLGNELGKFKLEKEAQSFFYQSAGVNEWGDGFKRHKGLQKDRIDKSQKYLYNVELKEIKQIWKEET